MVPSDFVEYIWHENNSYLSLNPITQVYGVCFDESGNILIKKEPGKSWNLPGGTPENNETPLEALKRELKEEAGAVIEESKMIGYYEVILEESTIYQLRFAARLKELMPQAVDPATGKLNERKLVEPDEFFTYVKIEDYRPMIDAAMRWYETRDKL